MPSEKYPVLLRAGPFKGFDATSADEYIAPTDASGASSNVDTHRVLGAMMVQRGRAPFLTNTEFLDGTFYYVTLFEPTQDTRFVVFCGTSGSVEFLLGSVNLQTGALAYYSGAVFDNAAQYGSILYTNSNSQLSNGLFYVWQQPPTNKNVGINVNCVDSAPVSGHATLPAGAYFYTFTRVVTYPGGRIQETSPDSNLTLAGNYGLDDLGGDIVVFYYQLFAVSFADAPQYATINNLTGASTPADAWSGTYPDGSVWSTNVYRQSSNQPTWFLLQSMVDGSGPIYDSAPDSSIAGNAQLDLNHDPPPFPSTLESGQRNGVLFVHVERVFVFTVVDNADTLNQAQVQLWWSDYGVPWSFNKVDSVTLVGNSGVSAAATTSLNKYYGDLPVMAVSLATCAALFKQKTLWLLYGNDPATFIVIKAADIGCVSRNSVTNCQGLIFWLSEEGVYQFDGNTPLYVGEKVRGLVESVPVSDQQNSVGLFADRTYWLSFPATGITIGYYLPTQEWIAPLPYACSAAFSVVSESQPPADDNGNTIFPRHNLVIAARSNTTALDVWFAQDGDLQGPATATWDSGIDDSQTPWIEKCYHYVAVSAPVQSATCVVEVDVYGFSATPGLSGTLTTTLSFNLAAGPSQVLAIPQANSRGFAARLRATITTAYNAAPVVLYSVTIAGTQERAWIEQT